MIRYNTTTNPLEGYNGAWTKLTDGLTDKTEIHTLQQS